MILDALLYFNHALLIAALIPLYGFGAYLFWLVVQHVRLRDIGMRRERELLSRSLPPDSQLPQVLVQIACFNERLVIRRIVEAVAAFDWPRDKLRIQILDDSTDDTPAILNEVVTATRARGIDVVSLRRTHRTGYKAGALQAGLGQSADEFVAVFDADFIPAPDFLRQCMRPLLAEPCLAFVGARWDHLNGDANALTAAQQRLKDCEFGVAQLAHCWAGHIVHFDGTCGIWRRAAIDEAGGWQWDAFSEDTDLSYRAQLLGWRGLRLASVGVPGELPETTEVWLSQQANWTKGTTLVLRKHLSGLWRSRLAFRSKLAASAMLGTSLFGPAVVVAVLTGAIDLLARQWSPALVISTVIMALVISGLGCAVLVMGQCFLRQADPWTETIRNLSTIVAYVRSQTASAVRVLVERREKEKVATPKRGVGPAPVGARKSEH